MLCYSSVSFAQKLVGEIKDEILKVGIEGVQVIHKDQTVLTNVSGQFSLFGVKTGDRIGFRLMGYETKELVLKDVQLERAIVVYLKPLPILLQAVNIRAPRNYQKDSLMRRKEYAAVFNYKDPELSDMFVKINPEERIPLALSKPASTSSIVKVNVLQVVGLLGKKKTQTSKLKSMLLADEDVDYLHKRFSKDKVEGITKLSGDSLTLFLQRYQPTAAAAKQMNDYQISIYIKQKLVEFKAH